MVKGVVNGVKTYYPGRHYNEEVDNSVSTVKKFYTMGSTTVAVRTVSGTEDVLNWILGDHLGSASVTANADGSWNSEIKYTAFGEVRASSGLTPTEYRYTNQLKQNSLGLYFYVARWYDPALAHFAQADTLVPGAGDSKAFDRYSYVEWNPIRYSDPSGHRICDNVDQYGNCTTTSVTDLLDSFGIQADELNESQQWEAVQGAWYIGQYIYETDGSELGLTSIADAYKFFTGGNVDFVFDPSQGYCEVIGSTITCGPDAIVASTLVHEYFHVADNYYEDIYAQENGFGPLFMSSNLPIDYYTKGNYTAGAYKCNDYDCIAHPDWHPGFNAFEAFANAGQNLVLGYIGIDPKNFGFEEEKGFGDTLKTWMENMLPQILIHILEVQQ